MESRSCARWAVTLLAGSGAAVSACGRSSLVDLPLWRVEADSSGQEVRFVQLPFEQTSYHMTTHAVVRRVLDRNQDGVSDRIITFDGLGGARTEDTDTDFDGTVDRWDTFGSEGQRLRSATARVGGQPDRIATYDQAGLLARVETDADLDGRFELVQILDGTKLLENRLDSDGNGRADRLQDFRKGYLSVEDFDTDEDGHPNLRLTYGKDGTLVKIDILQTKEPPPAPEGERR